MKKIIILIVLSFVCSTIFGKILPFAFEPKPFEEDVYIIGVYDYMIQQENKNPLSQSYDFSFKDKDNNFEVRYIMFSELEAVSDIESQVGMWAFMVIQNIAGDEDAVGNTTAFNKSDVKNEFNADYGLTSFIHDGVSDFSPEFRYNMISFFYKEGIGLMCQTILFNDLSFLQDPKVLEIFHSFRFE